MKIVFFLAAGGAASVRIRHFAKCFSSKGHVVGIVSSVIFPGVKESQRVEGVRIVKAPFAIGTLHPSLRCVNVLLSFLFPPLIMLLLSPDVLVVSMPPAEPAIGAIMIRRMLGKRLVFDYRDELDYYRAGKVQGWMSRAFFRFLKKLVTLLYVNSDVATVTPSLVNKLKKRGIGKLWLVPNGADTKIFRPVDKRRVRENKALSTRDFIVVYLGLIGDYYRLDVVVRALNMLVKQYDIDNVRLILLGGGPDVRRVLRLASVLSIAENVNYLGRKQDRQEVAEVIACADIGVVPYGNHPLLKYAYPTKVFEYCACGVPVIATAYRDSLLAGLIDENGIGLVVPPMNVEELALAVRRMYSDKKFREEAGGRARKLVEEHFDRDRVALDFLTLIESNKGI